MDALPQIHSDLHICFINLMLSKPSMTVETQTKPPVAKMLSPPQTIRGFVKNYGPAAIVAIAPLGKAH